MLHSFFWLKWFFNLTGAHVCLPILCLFVTRQDTCIMLDICGIGIGQEQKEDPNFVNYGDNYKWLSSASR